MKTTLILALMALSLSASGQFFEKVDVNPKMAFDYAVADGYKFQNEWFISYNFGNFRTRFGVDLNYRKYSLSLDLHTYMNKGAGYQFNPTRNDYFIGASYQITNQVKLTAEHLCIHPILSRGQQTLIFNGGHTSFSISYGY